MTKFSNNPPIDKNDCTPLPDDEINMNTDGDSPYKTVQITLEIRYDPDDLPSPYEWDWATLLDLPDREDVKIVNPDTN